MTRAIAVAIGTETKEVEIDTYKDYYKHLECTMFDAVRVSWNDTDITIYVDDEGLLKSGNLGRHVHGYPEPLFGNLVITGGVDSIGRTLDAPEWLTLEKVMEFIYPISYKVK